MSSGVAIFVLLLHFYGGVRGTTYNYLGEKYRFSRMLDDMGQYWLYWSFDTELDVIKFAVNVSTTGWVGFGLSPNGQMPQSDVVIGWVEDDDTVKFHVSLNIIKILGALIFG